MEGAAVGRPCLFCGERPVTREHAIPGWLLRELGALDSKGVMQAWLGPAEELREWLGSEIKVKHFCESCNSGWMSDLETQVKRTITPLLADLSVPLDRDQQRVLSLWAVKTAITLEATGPKDHASVYSSEERDRLRASEMPLHTNVFLGRNAVSAETFVAGKRLLQSVPVAPSSGSSPLEEGYATTLGFGRLVLQVLHVRVRPDAAARSITLHPRPEDWSRLLMQIWPSQRDSVGWPPPTSLSHAGATLDALAQRFSWRGVGGRP